MVHIPQQIVGSPNTSWVSSQAAPTQTEQMPALVQTNPTAPEELSSKDQVKLKTPPAQAIVHSVPLHDTLSLLERVDSTAKHVARAETKGDKDLLLNNFSHELQRTIPIRDGITLEAYDSGDLLAAKHHIERTIQNLRHGSSPDKDLLFAYSAVQKRIDVALYKQLN